MFCEDVFMRLQEESDILLNASIDKEVPPIHFGDLCQAFDPNGYFETPKHFNPLGKASKPIVFVATLSPNLFKVFEEANGHLLTQDDGLMDLLWLEKMSIWSKNTIKRKIVGVQPHLSQSEINNFERQNDNILSVFAEIILKKRYPTMSLLKKLLNEPLLFHPQATLQYLTDQGLLCPSETKVFLENSPWVDKGLLENCILKCAIKDEVSPIEQQKSGLPPTPKRM